VVKVGSSEAGRKLILLEAKLMGTDRRLAVHATATAAMLPP